MREGGGTEKLRGTLAAATPLELVIGALFILAGAGGVVIRGGNGFCCDFTKFIAESAEGAKRLVTPIAFMSMVRLIWFD